MMDLDELRAVQAGERKTDSLQSLRDSFYRDVAEYINGLHEERARAAERADDPFGSEEVRHLTDEIETAQEVAEAVYDRRLGKVVKRASLAAAGMTVDEEGLTDEEAELFAAVVDEIESRRGTVLSAFAGEAEMPSSGSGVTTDAATDESSVSDTPQPDRHPPHDSDPGRDDADERADPDPAGHAPDPAPGGGDAASGTGDPVVGTAADADAGFDASEAMGSERGSPGDDRRDTDGGDLSDETERPDAEGATPDGGRLATERTTVRITRDVGEVLGVDDSAYDLADGDVVTLPSTNAEPLLERDAARRIE
jgi:DNA replication factor GINS